MGRSRSGAPGPSPFRVREEPVSRHTSFRGFWIPAALVLPQVLIVLVWFYWPTAEALLWSLSFESPFGTNRVFVGLENLRTVVGHPDFGETLRITAVFAAATSSIAVVAALLLAFFADRVVRGRLAYRTILIVPYAIAAPVVGVAFAYVLHPNLGLMSFVNDTWPGLWNPFIDGADAMVMVVLAFAWKNVSYNFIFFLAGLQSIPKALIEAAAMEGAGPWRRFVDIQLPLLTPTMFFVVVIMVSEAFTESFGIVDTMTQGGPAGSTNILVYKIYSDGFIGLDFSGAAAQSVILMALIVGISILQFRYVERRVNYVS